MSQLLAILVVERFIAIQPQDPFPRGVTHAFVAGRREVVDPGKVKDPRTTGSGDFFRAIAGPGIDDDHLRDQVRRRLQTGGQVGLFILGDQAE